MPLVHIGYTIRRLESLKRRLDTRTEKERPTVPLTLEEGIELVGYMLDMARFVDTDCQNSNVPRPRFPHI